MRNFYARLAHSMTRAVARAGIKGGLVLVALVGGSLIGGSEALADVIPQAGAGAVTATSGANGADEQFTISGGQRSSDGANQFYRFDQFNLQSNQTATFITVPEVQNILGQISGGASQIDGLVQVLGGAADLYLINPSGILFGPHAQLNLAGSFTATTATDIGFGDAWLSSLTGASEPINYGAFTGNPSAFRLTTPGAIVNLGNLAVGKNQMLSLIGGTVVNTGSLSAPGGTIMLTAVENNTLVRINQGNQLLSLEVALPESLAISAGDDSALNTGEISPQTLGELLTGSAVESADGLFIEADGTVRLGRLGPIIPENAGSVIVAANEANASSGQISAANDAGVGGDINVLGSQVGLFGSTLNVSGREGGGILRVGGDYRGGPVVPTARQTYVDAASVLRADALETGNGGQVYVWSDDLTQFYGHLSAQGQDAGGFAEISAKQSLVYRGTVDLNAPQGTPGHLLLDPFSIRIVNGSAGGAPLADPFSLVANSIGDQYSLLYEEDLEKLSSVTLEAWLDIVVDDLDDKALTFQPGGNIRFVADSNNNGTGSFRMNASNTLRSIGGNISIVGGSQTINNSSGITVGDIDTGLSSGQVTGGTIRLNSESQITAGALSGNTIELRAADNIQVGAINAKDISLLSNEIQLAGGTGSVTAETLAIAPINNSANINLGSAVAQSGALNLSGTDLAALSSSLQQITIGRPAWRGALTLSAAIADGSANPFLSPVTILGAESASLMGPNLPITWNITGRNQGNLSEYGQLSFSGIGNIVGGSGPNTFVFKDNTAHISQTIAGGSGDLTLIGDDIELPNTLSGSGNLFIRPQNTHAAIQLGGSDQGEINKLTLTNSEINSLQAGFQSIQIGDENTGPITLNNNLSFSNPLVLRSGAAISTQNHKLTGVDNASITLIAGGDITADMIATAGQGITLTSPGNITVARLDARTSGPNGNNPGADITVTASEYFRATDSILRNGIATSVETSPGGKITIQHGGNGVVPFTIGRATPNGTAGQITDQTTFLNGLDLFNSYAEGNIQILTQAVGAPPVPPTAQKPTEPDLPADLAAPILDNGNHSSGLSVVLTNSEPASAAEIFSKIESTTSSQFESYLALSNPPATTATLDDVQRTLRTVARNTGIQPALLYVYFIPDAAAVNTQASASPRPDDQLEVMLIMSNGEPIRKRQWGVTRQQVESVAADFRNQVTSQFSRPSQYLPPAQQLYRWLISPLEETLQQQDVSSLGFIIDNGLRTIPLSALYSGDQFLIERYSLGLLPTFSLTDFKTIGGHTANAGRQVLAMGASNFVNQPPLPAVEAELSYISENLWLGDAFLNESFTLQNLRQQLLSERYSVVHLATHATFEGGSSDNSYIQLWDERLSLDQLKDLNLKDTGVDLIILSACNTALGDPSSEYGFAGLAVSAGSQAAIASLWPVSDEGTLGFMTQFYTQFANAQSRSEGIRQAQIAMLQGQIGISDGQVYGPNDEVLAVISELSESGTWPFSHPFYWSAFTMIGNPW